MESKKIADGILLVGGYYEDEHGDTSISLFLVNAENEEDAIDRLKDEGIHQQRCHHDYDCCGNLYGKKPEIIKHNKWNNTFLVQWEQSRNI